MSSEVTAAVIAGAVAILVSLLTSGAALHLQHKRLREELRTEFMAEAAILRLLQHERWARRSFAHIAARIGGFEEDELRRMLVRAGAVRFRSKGVEYWGLVERNTDRLNLRETEADEVPESQEDPT